MCFITLGCDGDGVRLPVQVPAAGQLRRGQDQLPAPHGRRKVQRQIRHHRRRGLQGEAGRLSASRRGTQPARSHTGRYT